MVCDAVAQVPFLQLPTLNPSCNCYTDETPLSSVVTTISPAYSGRSSGIACPANTFWAIDNVTHKIEQFQISGAVVTSLGVVDSSSLANNLAFCNNLDGGTFGPTFYADRTGSLRAYYYDGNNWVSGNPTAQSQLYNPGGNGNYLYYQNLCGGVPPPCSIVRYTGSGFTTIFSDADTVLAVADLAVDDNGNVWCFRNTQQLTARYLDVISPGGQILKRFHVNFSTNHAYGCFLLNGVLYVGFGSGNATYPNKLLPFTITNDSALAGTPLSMPLTNYGDLASCGAGNPLAQCSLGSPVIGATKLLMCANDTAGICAPSGFASYLWNTGQTDSCITTQLAGNYYVTVTDNNGCTAVSNRISISVYPSPPVSITTNGDTLTVYEAVTQQWYLNGTAINGATSNIYIATDGGSYTVQVTDSNGCVATSSAIIISGIDDFSEEDVVTIYPNPTHHNWQLTVGNSLIGSIAEVFDAEGRLVFQSSILNSQSLITFNAARGIYLLRISNAKNSVVRKLVRL